MCQVLTVAGLLRQEQFRQEGKRARSMGSRGSRQPDRVEHWVPRLTEARRSSGVEILVVTLRPWVPVGLGSLGVDRELFRLVDHRTRRWRDWSRLRWQ